MSRSVISIRIDNEVAARVRSRFYNPLTRKLRYGEMSTIGESLWRRWLEETEAQLTNEGNSNE